MTQTTTPIKGEQTQITPAENKKGIENHKQIAANLEAAAKKHLEAAKFHEAGEHEKAAKSTITAHGHMSLASEAQREDSKNHALNK
jgi:hypothetical protein